MYDYEKLQHVFLEKQCTLLSTKEELIQKTKIPKVRFISSCGHENTVFVNVFISRNTGVVCKDCIAKTRKKEYPNLINREIDFTNKFQEFISSSFISTVTNEACKSDLIIKPIDVPEDSWLRIQIKTTEKVNDKSYGFNIQNKYDDHILICHCIDESKYWLIPFNELELTNNKINLSVSKKSKYYKYYTENENIIGSLIEYYKNTKLYKENICMIAENNKVRKEQTYRKKIYDNLSFLKIEKPTYTNMVYDLVINDRKVQEKVLGLQTNKAGYSGMLFKGFGRKKTQNYNYQDNDFYWFHIPETDFFYVIPQFELLYRNIISFYEVPGRKSVYFHTEPNDYKHSWANEYLFNYKNINKEFLLNLLETDYTEMENAVMYIKVMELY
jgi:hypothetical protein